MQKESEKNIQLNMSDSNREKLSDLFMSFSFLVVCFFTFVFPLKFGLPYLSNIINFRPVFDVSDKVLFFNEWFHGMWANEFAFVVLFSAIVLYEIGFVFSAKREIKASLLDVFYVLFFVFVFVSAYFSISRRISIDYFYLFLSYYFYFFMLVQFMKEENKKKALYCIFFASFLLVMLLGVYQYFISIDETIAFIKKNSPNLFEDKVFQSRILAKKVFSTFIYSNSFAGFLILTIPLFFLILFSKKKIAVKIFLWAALVSLCFSFFFLYMVNRENAVGFSFLFSVLFPLSSLFVLLKTSSEGALLSLVASLFVSFVVVLIKWKRYRYIFGVVFLFFAMFIAGAYFARNLKIRKVKLEDKISSSVNVRLGYYKAAFDMARKYYLTGSGSGTFGILYSFYKDKNSEETQMVHNIFLQILVENGIFAFICFLMFLAFLAYYIWNFEDKLFFAESKIPVLLLYISFFSFVLHNSMDFDFYVPSIGYSFMFIAAYIVNGNSKFVWNVNLSLKKASLKLFFYIFILFLVVYELFSVNIFIKELLAYSHFRKGRDLIASGNPKKGVEEMKKAVYYDSGNDLMLFEVGLFLFKMKYFDGAEKFFEMAKKLSPYKAYYRYYYSLAIANNDIYKYGKVKRKEDVLREIKYAVDFSPYNKMYIEFYKRFKKDFGR